MSIVENDTKSLGGVVKDHVIWAGGLGFNSGTGQIKHSVVNGLFLQLQIKQFFGAVFPGQQAAEMGPAASYTLRRNIVSMIKFRFFLRASCRGCNSSLIKLVLFFCHSESFHLTASEFLFVTTEQISSLQRPKIS